MDTDTTPVPFHDPPSFPSSLKGSLLADEWAGSRTRLRQPDRILIVEDDLLIASQIETALTEAGFDIVGVATTREEAIEIAGRDPPALAIADIRLAGDRDGVDTALELFSLHGTRCIFASAYSDHEARQRSEAAVPLGWLQKPYSMASLTAMVRQACKSLRDERGS